VEQDQSNLGRTIKFKTRGGNIGEREVDIETTHNRMVPDYESGGKNTDVVFDRELKTDDGHTLKIAVVKSHSVRAQLIFEMNPNSGKVAVRKMYKLLDGEQVGRLRKLFTILKSKDLKNIKDSRWISGEED